MNSDSTAILYMLTLHKPNNIQSLLIDWVKPIYNKSGLNLQCCSMKIILMFLLTVFVMLNWDSELL